MNRIKKVALIAFCLLLLADLVYVNFKLFGVGFGNKVDFISLESTKNTKSTEDNNPTDISCGVGCKRIIEDKVATEVAKLAGEWEKKLVVPTPKVITQRTTTTTISEPKIVVIPIASSGETNLVNWTEVKPSGFYFDLANYPGAKEVRFEAYLLADQGGAKVYARLYDATNNRGVDYSDIQTNSGSYTRIQSSKISIWRGNNKYIVQLKSENGTVAKIKDAKLVVSY